MYELNAVVLGGNALNIGIVDILHSLNLNVIVVDYRQNISLNCDKHIIFDAKNHEIAKELRKQNIDNIRIVYTSMDNAGLAQHEICKEYGLKYAGEDAMLNAHHKNRMHQIWREKGLLNRESIALKEFNIEKIKDLNSKFKIIIKPSDSCASRGITILDKNSDDDVIKIAFEKALDATTNEFVNVEEFVEGIEFTVEMLGDDYGNVSVFGISKKYHTHNIDENKVAVKLHYNPYDIPENTLLKIANYGIECYKALGLKNSLGHLEVLLKGNGEISPVEIGARSSGFIASHLAQVGTGKLFLEEFINVLNGGKVLNGYLPHNNKSAMYYFYDIPAGYKAKKRTNIINFLDKQIKSIANDRSNLMVGTEYKKLTQDTDRYGYEILMGPKEILTIENVEKAEKEFLKELLGEV